MVARGLIFITALSISGCTHIAAQTPCPPPPPKRDFCTRGLIALYFKPGDSVFARPFGGAFGALAEVADRCEVSELTVLGLPDPSEPGADALTIKRAEQVRDFFAAFDLPAPRFDLADPELRLKPIVTYQAAPKEPL